ECRNTVPNATAAELWIQLRGGGVWRVAGSLREEPGDECLRLSLDLLEMPAVAKAFGVQLVHLLGAGRPHGKPAEVGEHFQPTDRSIVPWRGRQDPTDGIARELFRVDRRRGDPQE